MNAKELAQRLTEDPDFGEAGEVLGISLAPEENARLLALAKGDRRGRLSLADLLVFIERLSHGDDDLLVERKPVVGHGNTYLHLLGVRWKDGEHRKLTVGARTHWGSARIDLAWPGLAPWSRRPEVNLARAEQWARTDEKDRVTFEWRARLPKAGGIDEAGLRAAIVAAPDEFAPRLVFADWLLEQGNQLGELIHLSHSPTPDLERLKALHQSWQRWAGPLTPYTQRQFVKGGFVTEVTMTVPAFEKHGAEFFRAHPIRVLSLEWQGLAAAHLSRLSNTPALDLVRVLKLERGLFTEKRLPLASLADGDHFARLEELHLGHVGDRAADWRALFTGLRAPKLRRVKLTGTRTSASTLQALALNPMLAQLSELSEEQDRCFEEDPGRLWEETFTTFAERCPMLGRLELEGQLSLSDDALLPLFARTSRVSLVRLSLWRTAVRSRLLKAMANSPRSHRLSELSMHVHDRPTVDALDGLLRAPVPLSRLEILCNDRDAAEHLNAVLHALPPSAPLLKIRVRGSMQTMTEEGLAQRFEVLR